MYISKFIKKTSKESEPHRMAMKKLVIFTGAGISVESGLKAYRSGDGLWAEHRIEDVCTPDALRDNRRQVIEFYNDRRKEILDAQPNAAHLNLTKLEERYDVQIITQNVDDLHERAGSKNVLHLHGEILKLCSSKDVSRTVAMDGREQELDALHPDDGSPLRPFIVFFGEPVPMLDRAIELTAAADIFVVIGTSLQVYPAASLLRYVRPKVPVYVIDPGAPSILLPNRNTLHVIKKPATEGTAELLNLLIRI
jgi:NAD-dependent deacetylase